MAGRKREDEGRGREIGKTHKIISNEERVAREMPSQCQEGN
jgi:hypothetical protein